MVRRRPKNTLIFTLLQRRVQQLRRQSLLQCIRNTRRFHCKMGKSGNNSVIGIYGVEKGNNNGQRVNPKSILESNEWIPPT